MRGNRMMILMSEIDRGQESEPIRMLRALDKALDEIEDFGSPDGLTEEEMEILHASRPGTPPSERPRAGIEVNQ